MSNKRKTDDSETGPARKRAKAAGGDGEHRVCGLPPMALPAPVPLPATVHPERMRAIALASKMWLKGTVIKYYFFTEDDADDPKWASYATDDQKEAVRRAFAVWDELIGLTFEEVENMGESTVRIGFDWDDGSWSYVGTDIIKYGEPRARTMNFGWDLTTPYGHSTALHEIGHTIGLEHEHQSPFSGIVWDEAKVLEYFSGPPNNWTEEMIRHNVLNKLPRTPDLKGTNWDALSVMEYSFPAGLIRKPKKYQTDELPPNMDLSPADIAFVKKWYPKAAVRRTALKPFASHALARVDTGDHYEYSFTPTTTRNYTVQTFGEADVLMALYESGEQEQYLSADTDAGKEVNSSIEQKLIAGRTYVIKLRIAHPNRTEGQAVMVC